jgi:hypothetical protein
MTTPSTPRKAGPLLGTGAQTSWPFTFKVFAASDIAVTIANSLGVETALVLNADYSVTLNSNQDTSPGGTVTYPISGSALPTGSRLTIFGNLPYDQPLDLPSGGNFSPLALENQLDRLTMQIQQLREQVGRSLQVSVTSSADVRLPAPSANELIGWDSSGENLQNFALSDLATAVAYATMRYDMFTGDGVETEFALTADPAVLANLDVAIGGVTQVPGTDYSLVAGTLVFTSAPPNGAVILARYGEGLVNVSTDSSDVRFLQAGTGVVQRTAEAKMREDKSLNDFAGNNADARFANAKTNGTAWLRIPQGDHTITGWSIAESDSLVGLIFEPGARLLVTAASARIGLDIQKNFFKIIGECWIESTGTATDGLATVGIRQGHPTLGGKAFFEADRIRYAKFSSRGFVSYQAVYIGIGSIIGNGSGDSPMYGVSIERATIPGIGTIPSTTVQIGRSYISGATRGINLDGTGWVELDMPVLEYCGSASTVDGALHLNAVGRCVIKNIYGEQNYRNIVRIDATPVFIGGAMFTAEAADSISYVGTAFDQRGTVQIRDNIINARKIGHDVNDNADLTIGTNLTVPAAGGSVIFGNETMLSASGTLTSAAWTTVYTIPTNDMSGGANERAFYEYTCYAGTADLTTGFDAGTIMNGTMRSYTGTLPSWLRISGNTVQMNVTASSYGLNYKIVLRRVFPGN